MKKTVLSIFAAVVSACSFAEPAATVKMASNIAVRVSANAITNTVTKEFVENLGILDPNAVTNVFTNGVSAVGGKVARITIPSTNGLATVVYVNRERDTIYGVLEDDYQPKGNYRTKTGGTSFMLPQGYSISSISQNENGDISSFVPAYIQISKNQVTDFPDIPDAYTKTEANAKFLYRTSGGYVPLVKDIFGLETAVNISEPTTQPGFYTSTTGQYSFAQGYRCYAPGNYSTALGRSSSSFFSNSFVWNGDTEIDGLYNYYMSKDYGTFNINPVGGLTGFYIGDTNLCDHISNVVSTEYATKSYVTDANSNTLAIVNSWENFLDGSNVVFSITNYLSDAYVLSEAKLKIFELKTNEYHEVYNSRDEILLHLGDFETNTVIAATNALVNGPIAAVNTKVDRKADKAWGKYTSTGTAINTIGYSNTVYITEPTTVFAGGMEYTRFAVGEGSICILTTKGAPAYTTGDEGTFKFQDNGGTNYFGFAKTDSYSIGAEASGISVANNIVTITYNVTMSGVPCVWYMEDLEDYDPTQWEQLNLPDGTAVPGASHVVSWEQNPQEGTRVCYINCPDASGFFRATIEAAGSAKFVTNMPADLMMGIVCTNTATGVNGIVKPSYNGSTVIWTWSSL